MGMLGFLSNIMKKNCTLFILLCLLNCFLCFNAYSKKLVDIEQLKAEFVYAIIPYVFWKEEDKKKGSPTKICVIEGDILERYLRKIDNHDSRYLKPIIIPKKKHDNFTDCHVVALSEGYEDYLEAILKQTHGLPIFTVSNIKNFAQKGGIMEFHHIPEKDYYLKTTINIGRLLPAGLSMDTGLFVLSTVIDDEHF